MKRLLIASSMLLAMTFITSCLKDPGRIEEYSQPKEPDLHGFVDGMEIGSYCAEYPHAEIVEQTLMSEDRKIDELANLETIGNRFEPSASLVSEAKTKEGESIRFTVLALEIGKIPKAKPSFSSFSKKTESMLERQRVTLSMRRRMLFSRSILFQMLGRMHGDRSYRLLVQLRFVSSVLNET